MKEKNKHKSINKVFFLIIIFLIIGCGIVLLFYRDNSIGTKDGLNIVLSNPDSIPDYCGEDSIVLNNNVPCFSKNVIETFSGEYYSELDYLGRCGVALAKLHKSLMPTESRGEIGQIKPSGWVQGKYPGIVNSNPPYLYNRCHLIAYAMTGQNANPCNLITGTRHFNVNEMLSVEKKILNYLDNSDNHVLYRVTPLFKGSELVARGVEIEAMSVEDNGRGLKMHVFLYNHQPGITIDYMTGENSVEEQTLEIVLD